MKQVIFSIIFLICVESLVAQDFLPVREKTFKTTVINSNNKAAKGYLYTITDSTLFLSKDKNILRFYGIDSINKQIFNFRDIAQIQVHRKGCVIKGAIIGGVLTGLLCGVLNDVPGPNLFPGTNNFHGSFSKFASGAGKGFLIGAAIGACIGLLGERTFFIHGRKDKFSKMKYKMMNKVEL